jgi:hypothetical protein
VRDILWDRSEVPLRDFLDVMHMYVFFLVRFAFCVRSFVRLFGFRMVRVHANWIRIADS